MIGWKANYGYYNGAYTKLQSIDEIVFTDIERPFTLITKFNDIGIPTVGNTIGWNQAAYGVSYSDIDSLINAIIEIIGNDYYSVYCRPQSLTTSAGNNNYELLNRLLPSALLSCPNLFVKVFDEGSGKNPCVYIPALKRLWFSGSYLYKVNDDGSLSYLDNIASSIYPPVFCNTIYKSTNNIFPVILFLFGNYDGTVDSLINPPYRAIQLYCSKESNIYKIYLNYGTENNTIKRWLTNFFSDFSNPNLPVNPFEPLPPSGPDIPGGSFDLDSDIIPDSNIPTLSSANTGFTRIYNPSLSQVQELAQYLWTDETVISTIWNHIKQFFENPMEAIIGFNLVPVPVPNGGTKNFALMYIDTGVEMTVAASQFVDQDCGTLEIPLFYGSALDYSPYTKISCFLPYIGMVQLNTDEVMGKTLQVKYRVDIASGSCVSKILVNGNVMYQYSGHCAINIPISAADFSSYVSAAISVAKLAVGAAVGGAGGAVAAALDADVTQQTGSNFKPAPPEHHLPGSIPSAGYRTSMAPTVSIEQDSDSGTTNASFSGLSPKNISNTVGEIMGSKPHVQHSGSFSGNSGYLGVRRPFVIIERPNLCMPENFQALNGFPAMITMLLDECSGFTKVQQVQLTGMSATNPEQAEILGLLKGGVVF